jgi:MoaA/NifB/PqqE/SkfB family radical SAM enzyme
MIPALPQTIELHISNRCTGNCVVCSKAHGGNRPHFVSDEVMRATIDRLAETKKTDYTLQFGGDGDAFLHSEFLGYLELFRATLPGCHRCLYTSAFSLDSQTSRLIARRDLLNEIQIRIDSLDRNVYYRSTGMFLHRVLDNLAHLRRHLADEGRSIRLCVIYLPLYKYRQFCESILGKGPTYWERMDGVALADEWADIQKYFADQPGVHPVETRVTGLSLWAERTDCDFSDYPCPRLPENQPGDMQRQLYIYPDGTYGLCGYDDGQDTFILGNVFDDRIEDIWGGEKMLAFMDVIRNRTPERHPPCCINAKACVMWDELP